ncbi:MAG: ExbD/TolR family protein [Opitutaceae bacterium]
MITRPLDLALRLRPEPRNFDALFFVNVGLLVLFFGLFGSHFVLAPGLEVDFRLPIAEGANASAKAPTHVISVLATGQILTSHGVRTLDELPAYFASQVRGTEAPVLLVRGDAAVPTSVVATISSAAKAAGFLVLWAAGEPPDSGRAGGR